MGQPTPDPVRELEHTHGHLNKLVTDVQRLVHDDAAGTPGSDARAELVSALELLRDELLTHFANEEEALFPFIRESLPNKADAVDRLESAHDMICGAVTRLMHLAGRDADSAALATLHQRFESSYVEHSQHEAALLGELGKSLTALQRGELAVLLRGIDGAPSTPERTRSA